MSTEMPLVAAPFPVSRANPFFRRSSACFRTRHNIFIGRCCIHFLSSLLPPAPFPANGRSPDHIASARNIIAWQRSRLVSGSISKASAPQIMAATGSGGPSQADQSVSSHGGDARSRGRGWWPENQRGERSVRARRSNDEYRYWLHARKKPPSSHEKFVLVSYNILAVDNARAHWRELYYHIPSHIMHWHARKRKLLRELGLWSPDIICLQEVDRYHDMNEELQKEGYTGVYKGRTGTANDGCAMFWRQNRFELLEEESIEFREHDLRDNVAQLCVLQTKSRTSNPGDSEDTEPTTSGSKDSTNNRVVVGNIHVLFNPKRGDVKLGQARILLERAHSLSEKWGKAPVAIAGDFNSTPWSALYRFLSSSQLDLAGLDRRQISGQDNDDEDYNSWGEESNGASAPERCAMTSGSSRGEEAGAGGESGGVLENRLLSVETVEVEASTVAGGGELATEVCQTSTIEVSTERGRHDRRFSAPRRICRWTPDELRAATGREHLTVVQHNLQLQSSYSEIQGKPGNRDDRGEPFVTTYHRKFMGTVDYIWHTDGLSTTRVLDTLPTEVLERNHGLPSQKWGSDHLALACELSFVPGKCPGCGERSQALDDVSDDATP